MAKRRSALVAATASRSRPTSRTRRSDPRSASATVKKMQAPGVRGRRYRGMGPTLAGQWLTPGEPSPDSSFARIFGRRYPHGARTACMGGIMPVARFARHAPFFAVVLLLLAVALPLRAATVQVLHFQGAFQSSARPGSDPV